MASKDEDANDNVRANHAAIKPQSQDQRDPPDSGNDGGHIILPEAGDGHAESSHQDGSAPTRDQCDTPGCRGHDPDELAPKLAIQCTACLEELPSIKMFQLTCKH
ncbi:hypothetical protein J7T55_002571 [Diaporthe amygdali]|uniref:uncharacterized protein n=1 Tax=Phomopsis amygdali TaxID=1214568 RepID=UPI0022FF16A9|nr:uncharacterized protein J7T55_002571 [Diaporthe amygdali]KAJ0122060.1 hypothetical protein J7T55_002571 [Diaporthe amygdali]